ncbi:hypothetical protein [Thermomonas sp.]|uniref:hypothetical protein n=1 Tax=Thermomonas sp. TaxID=1971895 RepID=UPI002489D385|nr:hypothetical protein [Thermomonas sp.]MDI1252349.1 hypothetical protein [Thermomonas sp.]
MPHHPTVAFRAFALMLCLMLLPACQPDPTPATDPVGMAAQSKPMPAIRPVDAINVLAARLLARDGAGFARLAVPPDLHARLETGWRAGSTRWPLDELPLDGRLPGMLASLQEKDALAKFKVTFRRQFAGADRDIHMAIRTLTQFGGQYVQKEAAYTNDERDHVGQAIAALSNWALAAPLSDTPRADRFFTALTAAAQRSGIDGKAGKAAFAKLGMQSSLNRMSPFIATLLAQLRTQYGLDIDASLRGLNVQLLEQTGDSARLRLRYQLAGSDIDAIVPAVRIDGHWYLADFVTRAEASLVASTGAGKPASP